MTNNVDADDADDADVDAEENSLDVVVRSDVDEKARKANRSMR